MEVIYLFSISKKGISSKEVQEGLKIGTKAAWNITTKVRSLMTDERNGKLSGIVEMDETYIGGRFKGLGHPFVNKTTVFGMVARSGDARLFVVKNRKKETLLPLIQQHVEVGSTIFTDEHGVYTSLKKMGYIHDSVNHGKKQWKKKSDNGPDVYTNTIESIWSRVKNMIRNYAHVSERKLQTYLDEYIFRYNTKKRGREVWDELLKRLLNPPK